MKPFVVRKPSRDGFATPSGRRTRLSRGGGARSGSGRCGARSCRLAAFDHHRVDRALRMLGGDAEGHRAGRHLHAAGHDRTGADDGAAARRRPRAARSSRCRRARRPRCVQPSRCTRWPITQSSPTTVGTPRVVWMIEPSWIDVRAPMTMWPSSPRSTALGHTDDSGADGHVADDDGVGVDVRRRVDRRARDRRARKRPWRPTLGWATGDHGRRMTAATGRTAQAVARPGRARAGDRSRRSSTRRSSATSASSTPRAGRSSSPRSTPASATPLRPRLAGQPGAAGGAAPAASTCCVTVTLLDGLVLARSAFHHSMNYRSVVVYGRAERVEDPTRSAPPSTPSSSTSSPAAADGHAASPNEKELKGTLVLRLPLDEASAKVRTGGPLDDDEDMALAGLGRRRAPATRAPASRRRRRRHRRRGPATPSLVAARGVAGTPVKSP